MFIGATTHLEGVRAPFQVKTTATQGARIVLGLIFFVFGLNGFLDFIPQPPIALTVLAPVIVNIVAFHLFLAPSGLAVPIVVVALEIFLAQSYWSAFAGLMRVQVAPDSARKDRSQLAASAARRRDAGAYREPQASAVSS